MSARLAIEDRVLEAVAALKKGDWADGLDRLTIIERDINNEKIDWVKFARDTLERDYLETANGIIEEIIRQWRAGEFNGSRESVMESIEQSCDSACTYTHDCQFYLASSRYDDAYIDEFGEMPNSDGSVPWAALATYAMRAEVISRLKHSDIDINEDPPDKPQIECETCDEWKTGTGTVCDECKEDAEADADEPDADEEAD